MNEPTREVFGNVAPWMQGLFYALILGSLVLSALQVSARYRLWRRGTPGEAERDWRVWLRRLAVFALGQKRVQKRSLGGVMHALLFAGFSMLAVGTTLLFLADKGPVPFHRGAYYLAYELTMDLFGAAFVIGCGLALYRRAAAKPRSLGHSSTDYALLALLLSIGITGFVLEALRLRWDGTRPEVAQWSVVGYALSQGFSALDTASSRGAHLTVWWVHAVLIAAFFATFARTRFLHVETGTLNILLRPSRPPGKLATVPMSVVEETGRSGASKIQHFTRQQLLSLDACMECGRCEDACPALASGKPLSPKAVVLDLRRAMEEIEDCKWQIANGKLEVPLVAEETLWACTLCQACVFECPVLIGHVDLISDMRRHLVGEGRLSGPPAQSLRKLAGQGNPFGQPAAERLAWAEGLEVPTLAENPGCEVLLWVGCAASYDPRARKIARATVQLLQRAGVSFAVLGSQERCTGDPARRLGDEFLFQQLAEENAARLNETPRKIVTPCPHCMNTLRHEYPDFGGRYEVVHHTQLLSELVSQGKLQGASARGGAVTLHDPCYLARVNGETQPVRELIGAVGVELREMPRREEKTFCCGAGGGRVWFEERPDQRVNRLRAAEALGTGAGTLVTACPFCLNMMTDGIAGTAGGEEVRVLDIAELMLERLDVGE